LALSYNMLKHLVLAYPLQQSRKRKNLFPAFCVRL
jgi:hypothetical protein